MEQRDIDKIIKKFCAAFDLIEFKKAINRSFVPNDDYILRDKKVAGIVIPIFNRDYISVGMYRHLYFKVGIKLRYDLDSASEYILSKPAGEEILSLTKNIIYIYDNLRCLVAKALLSKLGIKELFSRLERYLLSHDKDVLAQFINNEEVDDTYWDCFAVLYVSIKYHGDAFYRDHELYPIAEYESLSNKYGLSIGTFLDALSDTIVSLFRILGVRLNRKLFPSIKFNEQPWDGIVVVPWKYVIFRNRYFIVEHPRMWISNTCPTQMGLKYDCPESKEAYNHISEAFTLRLPPIVAIAERGRIVGINNVEDISECIVSIERGKVTPRVKVERIAKKRKVKPMTFEDFRSRGEGYKSVYLNHLAEISDKSKQIYYCTEMRTNTQGNSTPEDVFIFRLDEDLIIYENVIENRASLVFFIENDSIEKAVEEINNFFSSENFINKRENLASFKVKFETAGIKRYKRILHNSFDEWKIEIDRIKKVNRIIGDLPISI